MKTIISGFSKLSRAEKVAMLIKQQKLSEDLDHTFTNYLHSSEQHLFSDISENVISNYYLPFSIAPNFLINDELHMLPMVIEESSVVAAASKAARFWANNGGFKTKVIDTLKNGQIYFKWDGNIQDLQAFKDELFQLILQVTSDITENMRKRGGGIVDFDLKPVDNMPQTYQFLIKFRTADSMGANFINTCLEAIAPHAMAFIDERFKDEYNVPETIMCILSNYTPDCLVKCTVSCPIDQLQPYAGRYTPAEFAERFKNAVDIAINDPYRAVTHNKGIFNGIDAVVIATGNDFRAIEAGAQAYAARDGRYRSLTRLELDADNFTYTLEIPLALGTVGGLTNTHPLAKSAIEILNHPTAEQLMQIVASAGMANNFSAVASLVTTGIQKGHMKLHLTNILNALNATEAEKQQAIKHFNDQVVSFTEVKRFLKDTK